MIRLNLHKAPTWLSLGHGVRVLCAPPSAGIMMAARAAMVLADIPENAESPASLRSAALLKAVGRAAILEWEGVGLDDETPAPVTPDAIDALLDLYPMAQAFEEGYMQPAMLLSAEKKGSAPSPNGTTAAARTIATPAPAGAGSAPIA